MKVMEGLDIIKKKDGQWEVNSNIVSLNEDTKNYLNIIYQSLRAREICDRESFIESKKDYINKYYADLAKLIFGDFTIEETETETPKELTDAKKEALVKKGIKGLINFFSEFGFEPNFRFINTFSLALQDGEKAAINYISNYFELIDNPYYNQLLNKMKSAEFTEIMKQVATLPTTKKVNNRLKLYYGSQGTGKTTIAMKETGNKVIVCNSSMLPSDLMEDFKFVDGNATFTPSALWQCMEEGTPIVLDEMNLLPFDSLRFLQGIVDSKPSFEYKGQVVNIKDGFQIIGTMNLVVNGTTYSLPEPLVDRCEETKKFNLTENDLFKVLYK